RERHVRKCLRVRDEGRAVRLACARAHVRWGPGGWRRPGDRFGSGSAWRLHRCARAGTGVTHHADPQRAGLRDRTAEHPRHRGRSGRSGDHRGPCGRPLRPDGWRLARPMKVLIIGSGPILIGQAAEFDYAGTQACRALREEGIETVLVNSNPATIMTDPGVADITYLEPLTVDVLERIIEKERPSGLLATLGGQTGLNLAVQLAESGALERYGVRLLGTPLSAIQQAEDREAFKQLLLSIGEPVPDSITAHSVEEALAFAARVGYALVVRPAFTLGGTGGGVAHDEAELAARVTSGVAASPIGQVLVERSLLGW